MVQILLKSTYATRFWLLLMIFTLPSLMVGQTVTTDKPDYAPGEVATISGSGWTGDSMIDIYIDEDPPIDFAYQHDFYNVEVDQDGNWSVLLDIAEYHLGVTFYVTVTGKQTGRTAEHVFKDAYQTQITLIGPTSGSCGETITFSAKLEYTIKGKGGGTYPVSGADLNFNLGETSGVGITNASGYATVELTVPANATNLLVSFAGSGSGNTALQNENESVTFTLTGSCCEPITTPTITAGSTTVCPGGSVELRSSATTGNQWFKNAVLITGSTSQTYIATESGSYTVVVTQDGCESEASDAVVISVEDVTDPVLTAEADQDVNVDENCSVTIPDLVDGSTATDNCTYEITQFPLAGTVVASSHNGTIAVTVTATDAAGNTDDAIVTLTAKDVTAPVLTAEADQDVNVDENCSVTIPDLVDGSTATDNCTYTITQSPAAGDVVSSEHNGTIAVTVTATDAAGNKDESVVTLTAKDVTAPELTAEADQDVNVDENCSVTIPDLVDGSTATDNCTYEITQFPLAGTVVASSHNGTIAVTVTATDAAGNTDDAIVTLTAKDVTAPVLTAEADQDVNVDENCSVTIPDLVDGSTATDNCTYTITQSPAAGDVVSSEHNGTIAVTVTATDAAGNKDESVVTLTAKDVTAPELTAEADQDVNVDENCSVTIPDLVDGSTATDNCTYTITQSPAAGDVVSSEHNGTIAVTVTATDAAGNKDESVVTLTAKDVTAPELTAEADQDVNVDENCSVTIPNLVDGSTATDNCTYEITQFPLAGTVVASSHNGTIAVTVTATDAAGNTDDAIVTLTAKDVTAPVLTAEADQDVNVDENCSVTIPDLVDGSTATDNCTYTIIQSPAAGDVVSSEHNGTIAVTVTATDAAGNKDESVVTLTAKDVTAPELTAEADQDVDLDSNCSVTIPDLVDGSTATDNCTYTITQSPAAGDVVSSEHNGTIAVTVTATDAAGHKDESVVTLTAKDVTAPELTAEADQDVNVDENCSVTIPNLVDGSTATDNCTYEITQFPLAGTVVASSHNGTIAVTVTATDAAGNTDDAIVTLTAKDVTAPVLTAEADQDVNVDENCSVTIPDLVDGSTATDNCTYTITQSPAAGDVVSSEHNGTIAVTVTATDAAGHKDESVVTLTAKDVTAPELTAEADQDVNVDENCSVTIPNLVDGSTATDNCTYEITQFPLAGTVVASSHNGTIAVTVTATDAAGNTDDAIVTLTAKDVTAPVLTAEADQDVNVDENCSVTIPDLVDGSTATDNCTYTIIQSPAAGDVVSSEHNGTIAVTVTATDAAGNKDESVVTLTAKDVTAPELTAEADQDVNVDENCSVTIPNLVDGSTATDNCTYEITQFPLAGTVVASSHNGTIAVTVTATDAAGNTDDAIVTLTAKDVTAPVLTAEADQDVNVDENCSVTIPDLVDGSTATDNCTYTIIQSPAAGDVVSSEHNGTIAVTVTATDAAGNKDESVVTLTAKDVTAPELTAEADQDVNVDENCSVTIPNLVDGSTATDNCTYEITQFPLAGTVVASSHNGTIAVTVTATDAAGNTDDAIVTLTAKDVTAPVLTAEADQDVNVDENCSVTIPDLVDGSTATDNCTYTITQSPAAGDVVSSEHNGTIAVTVTATDAAGNKDESVVTLTAKDVTAPELTAEADQDVNVDENCSVTIPNLVDGSTATDNCTYEITQFPLAGTVVASSHNGTIAVTVTATDAAGNTDDAIVTLTAKDVTAPVLTAEADQDVNVDENCSVTIPDLVDGSTATDNCTYTITQSPAAGDVVSSEHNGTIAVTVTATDAAGNKDESVVTLTAKDVSDPFLTCVEDQSRPNDPGTCSFTVISTEFDPYDVKDNCQVASITNNFTNSSTLAGAVFEEGETDVTWTVTDVAGNSTSCTFSVTVTNEAPVINSISGPVDPVQVNTGGVTVTATYVDNNVVSATWKLIANDGVIDEYTCEDCVGSNTIEGNFDPQPGVYTVELEVIDACGEIDSFVYEYIVIFDPTGGFVTGGGWIDSPEGALTDDVNNSDYGITGKANFGFNAKYKNGKNNINEVDGHTNFQFKAGDLHFSSVGHDDMSLVISGKKATYTGYGTVNGTGNHKFRLIAIDGDANNGSAPDEFRIKIWKDGSESEVLYDNMRGESESSDLATVLGGGSIVIHKPTGGGKNKGQQEATVAQTFEPVVEIVESMSVAPNPVYTQTEVTFTLKTDAEVVVEVFDFNQRRVEVLFRGNVLANQARSLTFNRGGLPGGSYFVKLTASNGQVFSKQIIIK